MKQQERVFFLFEKKKEKQRKIGMNLLQQKKRKALGIYFREREQKEKLHFLSSTQKKIKQKKEQIENKKHRSEEMEKKPKKEKKLIEI